MGHAHLVYQLMDLPVNTWVWDKCLQASAVGLLRILTCQVSGYDTTITYRTVMAMPMRSSLQQCDLV